MNCLTKAFRGTLRQRRIVWGAVLVFAALLHASAHALTCGQAVTGHVTLTADLSCQNQDGLLIQTNDVTIDLNGHTISCTSPSGFMGSCQPVGSTGLLCCLGISIPGAVSGTIIRGPGVISGFSVGIWGGEIQGVVGLLIQGVTITGPAIPPSSDFDNHRGGASGIQVSHAACSPLAPGYTVTIEYNDISNQGNGIGLSGTSCTLIHANNIHDNSWAGGGSGIATGQFGNQPANGNVIFDNIVVRNGSSVTALPWEGQEGGILITGNSGNNQVFSNNTSGNCGDGIALWSGAHDNVVVANLSVNNSTSTYKGQCFAVSPGTFFDVANRNEGAGNTWTTSNTCNTKNAGIPAGVCQ